MWVGKDTMHGSYGKLLVTIVVDQVLLASGPQEGDVFGMCSNILF